MIGTDPNRRRAIRHTCCLRDDRPPDPRRTRPDRFAVGRPRIWRTPSPSPHARSAVNTSVASRCPRARQRRSPSDRPSLRCHRAAAHSASSTVTDSTVTPSLSSNARASVQSRSEPRTRCATSDQLAAPHVAPATSAASTASEAGSPCRNASMAEASSTSPDGLARHLARHLAPHLPLQLITGQGHDPVSGLDHRHRSPGGQSGVLAKLGRHHQSSTIAHHRGMRPTHEFTGPLRAQSGTTQKP